MAEEEKKEPEKGQAAAGQEQDGDTPSMEDILHSIRGVISGEDGETSETDPESGDDVLELTDMVDEAGEEKKAEDSNASQEPTASADKSILDDIDEAIGADGEQEEKKESDSTDEKEEESAVKEGEEEKSEEPPAVAQEEPVAEAEPAAQEEPPAAQEESPAAQEPKEEEKVESNEDVLEASASDDLDKSTGKKERLVADEVAKESSIPIHELVGSINSQGRGSPYTRGGTTLEELTIEAMKPFLSEWLNENLPSIVRKIVEKEVRHLLPKETDD